MSAPSPLWYTTRGLGLTLLVTVSASVVMGVMTANRWKAEGWPRFLTADLHRNVSLLTLALLPLHALTVIADSFAHLGLRDVLVPFATAYRPLWLGMGVLAGELLVAVVAVSLVRRHLGLCLWRLTHWAVYAAWPLALLHGLGTGSDTRAGWALLVYVTCASAVLLAVLVRLAVHRSGAGGWRLLAGLAASTAMLGAVVFTMLGPLQSGWAAAAGTPANLLRPTPAAATSPGAGSASAPSASPAARSASPTAAAPTPAPKTAPAALPSGLDDPLDVAASPLGAGQRLTFTDTRDPTLQLVVDVTSTTATSGPLQVLERGTVVCQAQALFGGVEIAARCGPTQVLIGLTQRRGRLSGELMTQPA
ncbi:MAG TPA: hypothetical protein VKF59_11655 [Candidatus Dormibacteraeota bacterium]|nr:hypothetical protein [Candidatus Dormibacteraeota bacterium]